MEKKPWMQEQWGVEGVRGSELGVRSGGRGREGIHPAVESFRSRRCWQSDIIPRQVSDASEDLLMLQRYRSFWSQGSSGGPDPFTGASSRSDQLLSGPAVVQSAGVS